MLSSNAANITISSIPTSYDDLSIFYSLRTTSTNFWHNYVSMRMNSDSNNSYFYIGYYGGHNSGGTNNQRGVYYTSSTTGQNVCLLGKASTSLTEAATFGDGNLYIAQYRTANWKSYFFNGALINGNTSLNESEVFFGGGTYANTAAVNSLTFFVDGQTLATGSSIRVYGISKT